MSSAGARTLYCIATWSRKDYVKTCLLQYCLTCLLACLPVTVANFPLHYFLGPPANMDPENKYPETLTVDSSSDSDSESGMTPVQQCYHRMYECSRMIAWVYELWHQHPFTPEDRFKFFVRLNMARRAAVRAQQALQNSTDLLEPAIPRQYMVDWNEHWDMVINDYAHGDAGRANLTLLDVTPEEFILFPRRDLEPDSN